MKEGKHKKESVFELNGGMPPLGQALPLQRCGEAFYMLVSTQA